VPHGPGVPFQIDARFLAEGQARTFDTRLGSLELVIVPAGTNGYEDLDADAMDVALGEKVVVRVASLRDVIRMKEASGRAKDLAALPALYRTLDARRGGI
jgi:hypothetical protein